MTNMKKYYFYLMLAAVLFCGMGGTTSCSKDDDGLSEEELFENEMTAALKDASKYGPETDAFAREVAARLEKLMTEVQVKTYGMFYASQEEDVVRSVIGDSLYTVIHTKSGVEPGLSHYYYEIMRADTSSAATVEYYKKLAIEYHRIFEHVND